MPHVLGTTRLWDSLISRLLNINIVLYLLKYIVIFLIVVQIFGMFVNLVFLGQAFTIMLVYIWSRRNPNVRMNFFGLLNFQAPFLPWVLMGFSLLLGNSIIVDLLGKDLWFVRFIHLLTFALTTKRSIFIHYQFKFWY